MATYREYITRKVRPLGLNEEDVNDILGEAGLDATAPVDYNKALLALYNSFGDVIKYTVANVSEGGLSQSWNIEAIKLFYNQLCARLGKANQLTPAPRIRDKSNRW